MVGGVDWSAVRGVVARGGCQTTAGEGEGEGEVAREGALAPETAAPAQTSRFSPRLARRLFVPLSLHFTMARNWL